MTQNVYVTPGPSASQGMSLSGRGPYTAAPGGVIAVPDCDAGILSANGWVLLPEWAAVLAQIIANTGSSGGSVDATLAAAQQNLALASTIGRACLTPAAGGSTLGGMVAGNDDSVRCLTNESGVDSIVITHQDAGSLSANQFLLPNGASVVLAPWSITYARYVKTAWRVL